MAYVTDPAERERIKGSIREGELLLKWGRKTSGKKFSPAELGAIRRSIENAKAKLSPPSNGKAKRKAAPKRKK